MKILLTAVFLLMTSGLAFGQDKDLTCTRSTHEVQLTINENAQTAFFHTDGATAPSPAEFTENTIRWHYSYEMWQGRSTVTRTVYYILNRNTGTLMYDYDYSQQPTGWSCSASQRKF